MRKSSDMSENKNPLRVFFPLQDVVTEREGLFWNWELSQLPLGDDNHGGGAGPVIWTRTRRERCCESAHHVFLLRHLLRW